MRINEVQKPFEDKDLIEYFTAGLRQAIDAVKPSPFVFLLSNSKKFMEGINDAARTAHGLAHTQANPQWLAVRDQLEQMKAMFMTIGGRGGLDVAARKKISDLLEKTLWVSGKMAVAKALPRQDVLTGIELRRFQNAEQAGIILDS